MASQVSTGSPKMSRKSTPTLRHPDDGPEKDKPTCSSIKAPGHRPGPGVISRSNASTNFQPAQDTVKKSVRNRMDESSTGMNNILAQLRINDSRKISHGDLNPSTSTEPDVLDRLIVNLSDQHKVLKRQEKDLRDSSSFESVGNTNRPSGAETDGLPTIVQAKPSNKVNEMEMQRIRQELEAARSVISRQEQELVESRNLKHTMEQAMGPLSEADYPVHTHSGQMITDNQSGFNASARPFTSRSDSTWTADSGWTAVEGVGPDSSNLFPNVGRGRVLYSNQIQRPFIDPSLTSYARTPHTNVREQRLPYAACNNVHNGQISPMDLAFNNRTFMGPSNTPYGLDERMLNDLSASTQYPGMRRNSNQVRLNSTITSPLSPVLGPSLGVGVTGTNEHYDYQSRNFVAPVSPLSPEFPSMVPQALIPTTAANGGTYITPLEPMNYRRLLDKSVSCDWKYIVDKIVCNNDQQASIFLQQKLKVGTAEQKFDIVESIVNQAYPLMINRFGNFLVQRCFEHGTPDQIIAIANAIHGNVISLSMDPFGCHVIQKSFDSVPEDHKADMVRELLRRIPETVIHRYACHVWQKLFELRWAGEPPQIMLKVNEALRGMWHEVALGETGSLVVQNIFENCVEEEKRPAIEEVVAKIDLIAHGQFGNWCIQHLCEHGSPPDKRRVIDHILIKSYDYSVDQFASKVVEKCLKIGGPDFMDRYLGVIITARPDRPRIPLIDIAGDQYGNYLIQWILQNAHQHQREQVGIHIRKHMVSLRGSKFGSRVAMLCSNPANTTRPGPPATLINPYGAPVQSSRGSWSRYR